MTFGVQGDGLWLVLVALTLVIAALVLLVMAICGDELDEDSDD